MILNYKFFNMDIIFLFKVLFFLSSIIALYAVVRNLDIIKIILIYFKDKLLGK